MKVALSILVLAIVGIGGWYLIERLNTPSPIEIPELTDNMNVLDSIRGRDSLRYTLIQSLEEELDSLRNIQYTPDTIPFDEILRDIKEN